MRLTVCDNGAQAILLVNLPILYWGNIFYLLLFSTDLLLEIAARSTIQ